MLAQDLPSNFRENVFKTIWKEIESTGSQPRRLRRILYVPFERFKKKIIEQDPTFARNIIESLYAGDVYVLQGAFPKEFMINIKQKLHEHGLKTSSEFYKMTEGCPNFHRIIDENVAASYAFTAIKHSYYFFPWNSDEFDVFGETYQRWRPIKLLSGLNADEYEKNTPKDGVVDRLQVVHYPRGSGKIETHSDPFLHQRLIISCIMSRRGEDYKTGGVYFIDAQGKEFDCEDQLEIGDMLVYYPTILHGVKTVDEGSEVNWRVIEGRWWFGPFSNATDTKENRHTGYGVKNVEEIK